MKLAIMQPYFLPYIGYFQLMAAVDKFVIFDDVHFIKKGWINRNRILLNGREHLFTVPLSGASQNRLIDEIELAPDEGWRRKLLLTFERAYRRAPQFQEIAPLLREIISYPERNLARYLLFSLSRIRVYLEIATELIPGSRRFRNLALKGQARIIDICRQAGADLYVNPPGGRELYQVETFRKQNVTLRFLAPKTIEYDQGVAEFHPGLSIVDVLMFNARADVIASLRDAGLTV